MSKEITVPIGQSEQLQSNHQEEVVRAPHSRDRVLQRMVSEKQVKERKRNNVQELRGLGRKVVGDNSSVQLYQENDCMMNEEDVIEDEEDGTAQFMMQGIHQEKGLNHINDGESDSSREREAFCEEELSRARLVEGS